VRILAVLALLPALAVASPAERLHAALAPRLAPAQAQALAAHMPDYRVIALCRGNFSGAGDDEAVLALRHAAQRENDFAAWRVGLLRQGAAWIVRDIEADLRPDSKISHSHPLQWRPDVAAAHFATDSKCGPDMRRDADFVTASGRLAGGKPFFTRPAYRGAPAQSVCFATDDTYNNWDCLVYSGSRFRLWYQQAGAD
jgi:hypothetical protein